MHRSGSAPVLSSAQHDGAAGHESALRVLGKSGALRTWLRLGTSGEHAILQLDKHGVAHRCAVPLRDLRVLEPGLTTSFSTTLLCRERTMVINLEHVKLLVTAEEVLLPNTDLKEVADFAATLAKRLRGEELKASGGSLASLEEAGSGAAAAGAELPFEFRVLEAALEAVCGALETSALELEAEAHPVLDALASKVTTLNLERVKRVKGRMTRVTGRIAAVREEIQRFLDDDSDMRDMYLTRKAGAAAAAHAGGGSPFGDGGLTTPMAGGVGALLDPMDDDADIQQLEDLLETYFAQIDQAYNRMKALDEFVESTEDYINIDLDSKRNQLIQVDLLLSFAMFITSLFTLVTGVFGMNLDSGLQTDPNAFLEVCLVSTGAVVAGFIVFVLVTRQAKLITLF